MYAAINFVTCLLFAVIVTASAQYTLFERQTLAAHNRRRAQHGTPPLVLNRGMCAYAKEWAEYLAGGNVLVHRPNSRYGENLYMASGLTVTGQTAVDIWYNEIAFYNFDRPGFSSHAGHFTQVVWRQSRQLGVGVARRSGSTYVVANYNPPGNFQGRFPENVPRPRS